MTISVNLAVFIRNLTQLQGLSLAGPKEGVGFGGLGGGGGGGQGPGAAAFTVRLRLKVPLSTYV